LKQCFVFQDSTGNRWTLFKWVGVLSLAGGIAGLAFFVYSLLVPVLLKNPFDVRGLRLV